MLVTCPRPCISRVRDPGPGFAFLPANAPAPDDWVGALFAARGRLRKLWRAEDRETKGAADPSRPGGCPPLPAGYPRTWGAITADTLPEGSIPFRAAPYGGWTLWRGPAALMR